ncbi:uncharacterized protein SPSK_02724 [Sporothrix schenckii 1099-18]|uniref:Uncharacterized protein n=1 Tax=Sporothrix schenckii 1099-18 TaxID=1397361 RepID=A0A0F2MA47_SPOSC|nr:uncharacterized protein SPSK_02724 [Sporothrix schenckii 1099-18]KJR86568.1 hypothetical protein SPSK_02724 [Sporothrix schenckii 1099-18]
MDNLPLVFFSPPFSAIPGVSGPDLLFMRFCPSASTADSPGPSLAFQSFDHVESAVEQPQHAVKKKQPAGQADFHNDSVHNDSVVLWFLVSSEKAISPSCRLFLVAYIAYSPDGPLVTVTAKNGDHDRSRSGSRKRQPHPKALNAQGPASFALCDDGCKGREHPYRTSIVYRMPGVVPALSLD